MYKEGLCFANFSRAARISENGLKVCCSCVNKKLFSGRAEPDIITIALMLVALRSKRICVEMSLRKQMLHIGLHCQFSCFAACFGLVWPHVPCCVALYTKPQIKENLQKSLQTIFSYAGSINALSPTCDQPVISHQSTFT